METYYNLIKTLEDNLKTLEAENKEILCISEQGIKLCQQVLEQLQASAIKKRFNKRHDEIEFFKHIKPQVVSKLIFYIKRFNIESKRPNTGKKEQVKYLKGYIGKFQNFFNNNLEFYHYYKRNATHLDERYFLVNNKEIRLNIEAYHFYTDKQFSTSHDTTVATIIAYTKLIEYLKSEIAKLNNTSQHMETINPFQKKSNLQWTGTPTELVELSYAIHASGRINNSNVDKKEIILALQELFNAKHDNYYHTFSDIRRRKVNLTKFLDTLKESLIKYIKDLDDIK